MPEDFGQYLSRRVSAAVSESVFTLELVHTANGRATSAEECLVLLQSEIEKCLNKEQQT